LCDYTNGSIVHPSSGMAEATIVKFCTLVGQKVELLALELRNCFSSGHGYGYVTSLNFCFDAVDWVTGRASGL